MADRSFLIKEELLCVWGGGGGALLFPPLLKGKSTAWEGSHIKEDC